MSSQDQFVVGTVSKSVIKVFKSARVGVAGVPKGGLAVESEVDVGIVEIVKVFGLGDILVRISERNLNGVDSGTGRKYIELRSCGSLPFGVLLNEIGEDTGERSEGAGERLEGSGLDEEEEERDGGEELISGEGILLYMLVVVGKKVGVKLLVEWRCTADCVVGLVKVSREDWIS